MSVDRDWLTICPNTYLEFYKKITAFQRLSMESYHDAFCGLPAGLSVLDYGSGPCLLSTISAAPKAESIILAEYAAENRKCLHQWLANDPLAFNWSQQFNYVVCQLEGKTEEDAAKRQDEVRRHVKAVIECDLTKDPPIEGVYDKMCYDVVMSRFCVCAAANTHEEYRAGIYKLGKLVKPGGTLMLCDAERKWNSMETVTIGDRVIRYI